MSGTGTVTVVFTDLVGSTAMSTRLGDGAADQIRAEHFRRLRDAIAATGGTEVKNLGDGLMVVYRAASDAVAGAVAMQRVSATASSADAPRDEAARAAPTIGLKVGVSAGDALEQDGDWFGTPVNEAARLCGAASAGQILVAEVVRVLAGSRCHHIFEAVSGLDLKGLPSPFAALEVRWELSDEEGVLDLPGFLAPRTPLVDRVAPLAAIEQHIAEALAGRGRRLLTVRGVAGIGKTRLVAEAAARAHHRGMVVLGGRSDEHLAAPYRPWLDALRPVANLPAGARPAVPPELAHLVPGLTAAATPTARTPTDPDSERLLVFDAVEGFVSALGAGRGVLVVLDDLQWADHSSILLARHMVRAEHTAPVIVLATVRVDEVDDDHPLRTTIADLRRHHAVDEIDLAGLDETDTTSLLSTAAGRPVDAAVAHLVFTESEGNPYFAEELLAYFEESGAPAGVHAHPEPPVAPGRPRLTPGIGAVLGRRIDRLPTETRRLLETAALAGHNVDIELVASATGRTPATVVDHLDVAVRAGLLDTEVDGTVAFTHGLVRVALTEAMSALAVARHSAALATALEARVPDGEIELDLPDLARHSLAAARGGLLDPTHASVLAERAAHRAMALASPDEAADWYRAALDVVGWGPGSTLPAHPEPHGRRVNLLLGLADALAVAKEIGPTWEVLRVVVDLADAAHDVESLVLAFLIAVTNVDMSSGSSPLLARIAALLRAGAGDDDRRRAMAEIAGGLGAFLSESGASARACDAAITDGVALARRCDDPMILAMALAAEASSLSGRGEPHRVLADFDELGRLLEGTTISVDRLDPALSRVLAHLEAGDRHQFDASLSALRRWADEVGSELHRHSVLRIDSVVALMEGRLATAAAMTAQLQSRVDAAQETVLNHMLRRWLIELESGERPLRNHVDELVALADLVRDRFPMVDAELAALHARLGEPNEARRALDRYLAVDPDRVPSFVLARGAASASEAAARLAWSAPVAELGDQLSRYAGSVLLFGKVISVDGAASTPLGMLALAADDPDAAVTRLEEAIALEASIGATGLLPRTRTWLARALRTRDAPGDRTRAEHQLALAITESTHAGLQLSAAEARAVAATSSGRHDG